MFEVLPNCSWLVTLKIVGRRKKEWQYMRKNLYIEIIFYAIKFGHLVVESVPWHVEGKMIWTLYMVYV